MCVRAKAGTRAKSCRKLKDSIRCRHSKGVVYSGELDSFWCPKCSKIVLQNVLSQEPERKDELLSKQLN